MGIGSSAAQALHRNDEQFAITDLASLGLQVQSASQVLRRANDDRDKNVFDPTGPWKN